MGNASENTSAEVSKAHTQVSAEAQRASLMTELEALVSKAKKAEGAGPTEQHDEPDGDEDEGDDAEKKAKKVAKAEKKAKKFEAFKANMEKAGFKPEDLKKALDAAREMFEVTPGPGAQPPLAKAKKEFHEEGSETISKTVAGVLESIAKAKTFTPSRIGAIKDAITKLGGLLEELEDLPDGGRKGKIPGSQEIDEKGGLEPLPKGQGNVPPSGMQDIKEANPVMKALADLVEVTKSLATRMETVEKTRLPSTGGEAEVTDTVEARKGKASLFRGVV